MLCTIPENNVSKLREFLSHIGVSRLENRNNIFKQLFSNIKESPSKTFKAVIRRKRLP